MSNILKIDAYTGNWQKAINPKHPLELGSLVEVAYEPDAREWDDLRRHMASEGLDLSFCSSDTERRIDTFAVISAS